MKKLSLLLLLSVFVFCCCSDDDDDIKNEVVVSFEKNLPQQVINRQVMMFSRRISKIIKV